MLGQDGLLTCHGRTNNSLWTGRQDAGAWLATATGAAGFSLGVMFFLLELLQQSTVSTGYPDHCTS